VTNPHRKTELLSQLRQIFTNVKGIDKVYGVEEYSRLGLPIPTVSDQAPDLFLVATPDYMFSSESEGDFVTHVTESGTHGYINTDPEMHAIFMAWGVGIPKGIRLESISNLDVAPTIAALLGLDMKQVGGHPIPEIIKRSAN
jgi:predicted AlkP superfamily pyrophosphatase or phosphodiesterase